MLGYDMEELRVKTGTPFEGKLYGEITTVDLVVDTLKYLMDFVKWNANRGAYLFGMVLCVQAQVAFEALWVDVLARGLLVGLATLWFVEAFKKGRH